MRVALLLILCLFPLPLRAAPDLCEGAAVQVAAETGVPADLMLAITLAETGRSDAGQFRPWPWAANADGRGYWFDTRAQALAFARGELAAGRPLFDLGCFQINWRWHGAAFADPADLLDPLRAARHAAGFLQTLRRELGSWEAAAGAYHSRTPARAAAYGARVAALRATVAAHPPSPLTAPSGFASLPRSAPPAPMALAGLAAPGGSIAPGSLVRTGQAPRALVPFAGGHPWH